MDFNYLEYLDFSNRSPFMIVVLIVWVLALILANIYIRINFLKSYFFFNPWFWKLSIYWTKCLSLVYTRLFIFLFLFLYNKKEIKTIFKGGNKMNEYS